MLTVLSKRFSVGIALQKVGIETDYPSRLLKLKGGEMTEYLSQFPFHTVSVVKRMWSILIYKQISKYTIIEDMKGKQTSKDTKASSCVKIK